MAEVNPRGTRFCHLMEEMIPKEFQQVAVSSLRPGGILLKPGEGHIYLSNSCCVPHGYVDSSDSTMKFNFIVFLINKYGVCVSVVFYCFF